MMGDMCDDDGMNTTNKPRTVVQQAHAEFTDGDGIIVLFPNGEVRSVLTPDAAIAAVRRHDAKQSNGHADPTMLVTVLTWHNVPTGFVPPE